MENKTNEQNPEVEHLFTDPEPWEKWESKLVYYSIIIGVVGLTILGVLINWLIL
jgi:cytochrome b561